MLLSQEPLDDTMGDQTSAAQKRTELRRAIVDLTERGLSAAAKWAGEQLAGDRWISESCNTNGA